MAKQKSTPDGTEAEEQQRDAPAEPSPGAGASHPPPLPEVAGQDVAAAAPPRTPPPTPGEPVGFAEFPEGFWRRADYLLQHPDEVAESLKTDRDLWPLSRIFVLVTIVMSALSGAVMGATNLLQGSEMALWAKLLMILFTAVKVPVLFLLAFAIVLPPIYVSNAFMGARLSFRVITAQMLAALAITATVLASMASVAFFFGLTTGSYDFIKLLHVLFFAYAGLAGMWCLAGFIRALSSSRERRLTPTALFVVWLVLYGFVGTQLAWVLRPFVGSPDAKFQVFRERRSNFYESVLESMKSLIED